MQNQFSITENCSSPLLANGFSFEGVPKDADPPDNTGGGTSAGTPEPEEEEEGEETTSEGN